MINEPAKERAIEMLMTAMEHIEAKLREEDAPLPLAVQAAEAQAALATALARLGEVIIC